ncbi:DUF726-domain-containing protein [Fimicolochytrium jonesii]|uniref:DUF726-domain-containing protein n=1 Tax=Fimicolochytrium jonesii TaxID=1396493 RepID=UPI0022FDBB42|nr:DUF726-domain-containing protein [Fimicolochytrium jonesii]KAI8817608.1 DUF726-domain-containing protein [Fimicolochytrium jonesii]
MSTAAPANPAEISDPLSDEQKSALWHNAIQIVVELKDQHEQALGSVSPLEKPRCIEEFQAWADGLLELVWIAIMGHDTKGRDTASVGVGMLEDSERSDENGSDSEPSRAAGPRMLECDRSPLGSLLANAQKDPPKPRIPIETATSTLRTILFLSLTTTKTYDPRTRQVLRRLARALSLSFPDEHEIVVAETLKHPNEAIDSTTATSAAQKRAENGKQWRSWKVGLATVAGGLAIGLTGGLAAPLVGAGVASVLGAVGVGGTAAGMLGVGLASSAAVVGSLFGAYGGHMTGKAVSNATREVEDFEFVEVSQKGRVNVLICISGWLTDKKDVSAPWNIFNESSDVYALKWEVSALLALGNALSAMIKSQAIAYVKGEILKRTVLASLMTAMWPLGLVKVGKLLDNPWNNAKSLANKAGPILGDVLQAHAQGNRPVSIVAYSLGSLLAVRAVLSLPASSPPLVENLYLLGSPLPLTPTMWQALRARVPGRIVNFYSTKDWVLGFLHRATQKPEKGWGVAGLQPVNVDGIENICCDEFVEGHVAWRARVGRCLELGKVEGIKGDKAREWETESRIEEGVVEGLSVEEIVQKEVPPLPYRPPADENGGDGPEVAGKAARFTSLEHQVEGLSVSQS